MHFSLVGGVVGVVGVAAIGLADTTVPIHVEYSGSAGCTDGLVFGEQLRSRAQVRFVREADATSTLIVHVTRAGKRVMGRLVVRDANHRETERNVAGDSCEEVVSGLALVSAIALGFTPTAETADAQADVIESDAVDVAVMAPDAITHVEVELEPRDAALAEAAVVEPRPSWSVSLGAEAELLSDVSPKLSFAVPLYIEVARAIGGSFGLATRLRFARSSNVSGGSFTWTAGGVDLCPLVWSPRPFGVDFCARTQFGVMDAFAVNVAASRDTTRAWLSIGPVASMRLYVVGPAYLHLEGALDVPLIRDRFFAEPNTTLFLAPNFGWTAALGAGATIW